MEMKENRFARNVIVADADYIDRVAFNLIVNFERMLGRRIPQADMARWVECVALDSGLRQRDDQEVQVVLVHDSESKSLENFVPSSYGEQLDGQAFKGPLGEFTFCCVTTEGLASTESLFCDTVEMVARQETVHRLMMVPGDLYINNVRARLRNIDDDRLRATLFSMQPVATGGLLRMEMLGYSLMQALGIRADEINDNLEQQNL